jgi:hypothetical protein
MANLSTLSELSDQTIKYLESLLQVKELFLDQTKKELETITFSSNTKSILERDVEDQIYEINNLKNHINIYKELNR